MCVRVTSLGIHSVCASVAVPGHSLCFIKYLYIYVSFSLIVKIVFGVKSTPSSTYPKRERTRGW